MHTTLHPASVTSPPATPEPGSVPWLAVLLLEHGEDPDRGGELGGPFFPQVSGAMRAIRAAL